MLRLMAALALMVCLAPQAFAQRSPVVVELFTSQGCSSCPPADALLHELAARDDVIAIALHVDYWDYIGWKDEFADPRNAERQRTYAQLGHRRSIYTPEFIINGTSEIVGAKPMDIAKVIAEHQMMQPTVSVSLRRDGAEVHITARALIPMSAEFEVHLLRYQPTREARISRGENAGKDFIYANVSENWQVLGLWDARSVLEIAAEAPGDLPTVVLIQRKGAGEILAAAQLR
ncbi:MAG: DUF1223 domain-containing protein [Roseobacter sp.]